MLVLESFNKAHYLKAPKRWLLGRKSGGTGQNEAMPRRLKLHHELAAQALNSRQYAFRLVCPHGARFKKTPSPSPLATLRRRPGLRPSTPAQTTRGSCISLSVSSRSQITEPFHAVRIGDIFQHHPLGSTRVTNCLGAFMVILAPSPCGEGGGGRWHDCTAGSPPTDRWP